jgi:hypothetical protein
VPDANRSANIADLRDRARAIQCARERESQYVSTHRGFGAIERQDSAASSLDGCIEINEFGVSQRVDVDSHIVVDSELGRRPIARRLQRPLAGCRKL